MRHKKLLLIIVVVLVVIFVGIGLWLFVFKPSKETPTPPQNTQNTQASNTTQPTPSTPSSSTPVAPTPTPTPPVSQWPVQLNMTEAASITVDVNKKHKLPDTYVPAGLTSIGGVTLRAEAATAMTNLLNAASLGGHSLKLISGYRSFASQKTIYNNYVAQDGQAAADTYSARPGFSEHQTGLAADVGNGTCDLEICFGDTPAGKWIAVNAQNYGFIVRYPQGKEAETGYQYEPWHLRYLGIDNAQAIYASGKTMDQYYGIAAGGYQ